MPITVHKCHAQGNDFLVIARADFDGLSTTDIIELCHRKKGLGCDQLVVIDHSDHTAFTVHTSLFNQDASPAKLCLNAGYALSQYYSQKWPQQPWIIYQDQRPICQTQPQKPLSMQLELNLKQQPSVELNLDFEGTPIRGYYHNLGNEHWLIPCPHIDNIPLIDLGAYCQQHPRFQDGINVTFYQQHADDRVSIRTYERGVGPTLSCGSATLAVWYQLQQPRHRVEIQQPGGQISLEINPDGSLQWQGQYQYIAQAYWHGAQT